MNNTRKSFRAKSRAPTTYNRLKSDEERGFTPSQSPCSPKCSTSS